MYANGTCQCSCSCDASFFIAFDVRERKEDDPIPLNLIDNRCKLKGDQDAIVPARIVQGA